MNNESLNQYLAERIMGWKTVNLPSGGANYIKSDGTFILDFQWNPAINIKQAFVCLDTFEWWEISKIASGGHFGVDILNGDYIEHESLPMAISLACAKTSGY